MVVLLLIRRFCTSSQSKLSTNGPRLSKVLANSGLCSRREAEKWIIDGRVKVNGSKKVSPASKISLTDIILLDDDPLVGNPLNIANTQPKLWAVYKLKGELTAKRDDNRQRPLLFDRLKNVFPTGDLRPIFYQEFNTEVS